MNILHTTIGNKYSSTRNPEGYLDLTASKAIHNIVDDDRRRMNRLVYAINNICDLAGFSIEERIVLKDNKTGQIWR